jgi:Flp pilus assembly pilin Flp
MSTVIRPTVRSSPTTSPTTRRNHMTIASRSTSDEDGSLVTEYGLLAVVAATIAGVLIQWATSGALINLFNALIDRARALVGA